MSEQFVIRGRGDDPKPLRFDETIISLSTCPSCNGRGWFLINPFATGGRNGLGGIGNMTQCVTCLDTHAYFQKNGKLPDGIPYPDSKEKELSV